jgi:post-segregation antitoxin (ccd killing protein)
MKAKLTVTIDEELIPKAKSYARRRGLSVSELVETSLRAVTEEPDEGTSFSQRWRGKFQPAGREDERYQALAKRYLRSSSSTRMS